VPLPEPASYPFLLYALAVGLIVGSFLNVVIHRVPRGASVAWPGSTCPWCSGKIAARDNIPIFSWLLLRGRCRKCSAPISARYPAVEALTGALFLAAAFRFPSWTAWLPAAVLCALAIALATIDVEHLLLPDAITFTGMVLGLALQPWIRGVTILEALLGLVLGAGGLFLLAEAWLWLRGEEGLGLGDAKLLGMFGAFLGWQGAVATLVLGSIAGATVGLGMLLFGRAEAKTRLPFGLFLSAGALLTLFWGPFRLLQALFSPP
jgi:leader peptidase (prepilin peptidase)/N-methyltransferase